MIAICNPSSKPFQASSIPLIPSTKVFKIGISIPPITSIRSPNLFCSCFNPPAPALAAASLWPSNCLLNAAVAESNRSWLPTAPSIWIPYLLIALVLLPTDLATRSAAADRSIPLAVAISWINGVSLNIASSSNPIDASID